MNSRTALVLLCAMVMAAGAAVTGRGAEVDFDQGADLTDVIEQVKNADYEIPEVKSGHISPRWNHDYTRDCVAFSFGPDDPLKSEGVWLRSQEWREECTYYTGPNGHQIPNCHTVPGQSWRQKAQIIITQARELFPWERETFEVCLEGPWMDIYTRETAYKYHINAEGSYNTVYKLTPQEKIPMAPDSAGLAVESFAYNAEAKNFMLDINDIWVDYYQGEQVSINAVLYKDVQLWFDEKIGESDMTFDSADGYVMLFDFGKKLKPGKYYVKWGFERIGKVSTDKYIKKGNTEKVEVK